MLGLQLPERSGCSSAMLASKPRVRVWIVGLTLALATTSIRADVPDDRPFLERLSGGWGLYGATVGAMLEDGRSWAHAGVEVSFVHVLPNGLHYGWMAELRFDERAGVGVSAGLEGGWGPFVLELAAYLRFPDHAALAFRGRGCLSSGAVSICAGGGVGSRETRFVELAFVLKYPRRR